MKVLIIAATVASLFFSVNADSFEEGDSGESGRCWCNPRQNYCSTNVGTNNVGCLNTNSFIQCVNTVCTGPLTCPLGQVWSTSQSACAPCPTGQHIHYSGKFCVCDSGTTLNRATKTCDPCPTGSNVRNDSCSCPRTYVLDRTNNACSQCPAVAPIYGEEGCQCSDPTLFWNKATLTCQACPGRAVQISSRRLIKYKCVCNAANEYFDDDTVTCIACPALITRRTNEGCACNMLNQVFSKTSLQCACRAGMQLNAAGNACVWIYAPVAGLP
jgi:hypothetical protein